MAWPSACRGVKLAQADRGKVDRDGRYVAKDLPEGYKWFWLAADGTGYDFAANLGKMYRDGLVLKMSPEQIVEGNRRVAAFVPN